MKTIRPFFACLSAALLCLNLDLAFSGAWTSDRWAEIVTTYTYTSGPNDTPEIAHALALFGAKYEAVVRCADQLGRSGLLQADVYRKNALFCLVADALPFNIVEQRFDMFSNRYTVKISSTPSLADFVKADIRNGSLDDKEMHYSWKEEMEPTLSPAIAPSFELSRAYRYLSNGRWRMAIIYMNQLEKKYAHWGELYMAKACAYLRMHEKGNARGALESACSSGVRDACQTIRALEAPD